MLWAWKTAQASVALRTPPEHVWCAARAGIAIGGDAFPGSTLSDHCLRYEVRRAAATRASTAHPRSQGLDSAVRRRTQPCTEAGAGGCALPCARPPARACQPLIPTYPTSPRTTPHRTNPLRIGPHCSTSPLGVASPRAAPTAPQLLLWLGLGGYSSCPTAPLRSTSLPSR